MIVPSERATIAYFSSLGYAIKREGNNSAWSAWVLGKGKKDIEPGDYMPLENNTYPSLLMLWAGWMEFAADCIYEDFMGKSLESIWNASDDEGKVLFAQELWDWKQGNLSFRLKTLLARAPGRTPDGLPTDWKRWMHQWMLKKQHVVLWKKTSEMIARARTIAQNKVPEQRSQAEAIFLESSQNAFCV